jgi:hypothetical protein
MDCRQNEETKSERIAQFEARLKEIQFGHPFAGLRNRLEFSRFQTDRGDSGFCTEARHNRRRIQRRTRLE